MRLRYSLQGGVRQGQSVQKHEVLQLLEILWHDSLVWSNFWLFVRLVGRRDETEAKNLQALWEAFNSCNYQYRCLKIVVIQGW